MMHFNGKLISFYGSTIILIVWFTVLFVLGILVGILCQNNTKFVCTCTFFQCSYHTLSVQANKKAKPTLKVIIINAYDVGKNVHWAPIFDKYTKLK